MKPSCGCMFLNHYLYEQPSTSNFPTQPRARTKRPAGQPATQNERPSAITADGSQQDKAMYARLHPALLPKALRGALSGPQSGSSAFSPRHSSTSTSTSTSRTAAASLARFSDFVRGMVGGTKGYRETTAAISSKLEGKVIYLDSFASGQTEAQSAGARTDRQAGRAAKRGLSGKRCKQMVSGLFSREMNPDYTLVNSIPKHVTLTSRKQDSSAVHWLFLCRAVN